METFNFSIDKKVTVWDRSHYAVNAETKEEAIEMMKQEFKDPEYPENGLSEKGITFIENETLYDTEEELTPEDNGGQSTAELMLGTETILTNHL